MTSSGGINGRKQNSVLDQELGEILLEDYGVELSETELQDASRNIDTFLRNFLIPS
jgi:hypothetical protein